MDALRKMCEIIGIKPLVERSRSGKGSASINLKSFHYYDRMYTSSSGDKYRIMFL